MRDVGYGVYDVYGLGEFDQRDAVPAKYGTKNKYFAAVAALHAAGVSVVADVILNHHMGGEAVETVRATPVDPGGRRQPISEIEGIQAWTRYRFPGHGDTYSDSTWDWMCFDSSDWDETREISGAWPFEGKQWNENVDDEFGNYDYLVGCDVDVADPKVRAKLSRWGCWYVEIADIDGLRLDAVKHIGVDFFADWLPELHKATGCTLPAVGEYWFHDAGEPKGHLGAVPFTSLFDVPSYSHPHAASNSNGDAGPSRPFEDTLADAGPVCAATFIENHDTQPGQSPTFTVQSWFKPLAYAVILLREAETPHVFWGDLLGTPEIGDLPAIAELLLLMAIRRAPAHGPQHDVFDASDVVGFAREDNDAHPGPGLATILSDRLAGTRRPYVGVRRAERKWVSVMGGHEPVVVGDDGVIKPSVGDGGLSIYMPGSAESVLDDVEEYRSRVGDGN